MEKIEYAIEPMIVSKDIIPYIMREQYKFRQTGDFNHNSMVVIADLEEPIWWNRPEVSEVFSKKEDDGLYSLNFPYFDPVTVQIRYKVEYNTLLNAGCVPVAMQLRIGKTFKASDINALRLLPVNVVYNTLIELGVSQESLKIVHNDLLCNGKKFMGVETIIKNNWISLNFMVTLFYKEEEAIFQRLTGKYALVRGITGVIDETHLFTKEEFVTALMKNLRKELAKYYTE